MYREDSASFNATVNDTNSLSDNSNELIIETGRADKVRIWIDNGTTGSAAGSYDLTIDIEKKASHFTDDWMQDYSVTGSTALTHSLDASGTQVRLDLTNQSGTDGTYRIFVESIVVDE